MLKNANARLHIEKTPLGHQVWEVRVRRLFVRCQMRSSHFTVQHTNIFHLDTFWQQTSSFTNLALIELSAQPVLSEEHSALEDKVLFAENRAGIAPNRDKTFLWAASHISGNITPFCSIKVAMFVKGAIWQNWTLRDRRQMLCCPFRSRLNFITCFTCFWSFNMVTHTAVNNTYVQNHTKYCKILYFWGSEGYQQQNNDEYLQQQSSIFLRQYGRNVCKN